MHGRLGNDSFAVGTRQWDLAANNDLCKVGQCIVSCRMICMHFLIYNCELLSKSIAANHKFTSSFIPHYYPTIPPFRHRGLKFNCLGEAVPLRLCGLMDKAMVFGMGDSRFESCQGGSLPSAIRASNSIPF